MYLPPVFLNRSLFSFLLFLASIFLLAGQARASHNVAGQITYRKIGTNLFEITLTTYTDPAPAGVDRCVVDFEIWGNPSSPVLVKTITGVPRNNGPAGSCSSVNPAALMGVPTYKTIKENTYTFVTSLDPGVYEIRFFDMARIDNVLNMLNSGNTAFHVSTQLFNIPGLDNDSPQLLNRPLDFACVGEIWTHNPGGFDPDGDSLVYSLIPSRQYNPPFINSPIPVANYQFPNTVGGSSSLTIDRQTGLVTWNAPLQAGIYNVAILVEEYKNGVKVGQVIRDMAIFVENCDNSPPQIIAPTDTCIYAGDTLIFDVLAFDPDDTDSIYFQLNNGAQGNNGPFTVSPNSATMTFDRGGFPPVYPIKGRNTGPGPGIDTINGTFTWVTDCKDIRNTFYQVDFYAHDNFSYQFQPGKEMLSKHHTVKIRVVPRPVTNLVAAVGSGQITLNWDPHSCSNAAGYYIYKLEGGGIFNQDTICCDDSPESAGFSLIGTNTGHLNTTFVDPGPFNQAEVCYVVVAFFADGVTSCASNQECVQIIKGQPFMTNDSVGITDATNGTIFVSWSQPDSIDQNFFPPPYTYVLSRAVGISGTNYQTVATGVLNFNDTTYLDQGLNTAAQAYRYRVEVLDANNQQVSLSNQASSIFLSTTGGDRMISLSWSENVPWLNDMYYIYRSTTGFGGPYILHDSVPGTGAGTHSYADTGLVNGAEYCYFIRSYGDYTTSGFKTPLINDSQKSCAIAVDETPPCLPPESSIDIDGYCDNDPKLVAVKLVYPDSACAGDADFYTIWFAPDSGSTNFTAMQTVPVSSFADSIFITFRLESLVGCWAVSLTDTNGNESALSTPVCFDNCPIFEISNVFTPNGDGVNDFFAPVRYRDVKLTAVHVYNRWGVLIHTNTADMDRLWDGKVNGGKDAPDGVYYYVLEYEEIRLGGNITKRFTGNVTLLR